ncbi:MULTISPECIES: 4-(cytidine 5'-diphospho)-2-C-methyl-D-erythritol kinase [Rhodococcus]|uniref:4-diphosphocytidyl-2-C-methyl-D-erythritol kinase n=1 Tax=Rhodococcus oxybenzonivorans TaxID=1990687 RepID=A0AAE4UVL7_9NOCA|nr:MULTISPECIES: 4-(cytidine 5'-diphospho)-2-C-methyl-D-erythritol kinase [Rhodococcus]MDV7243981.1 4-(cytidine 5'-diphospho)-2-C-methyl-D-erythritol kinase [Rhodococcus oxybenzonivorans]MDV7263760.1 4-(cytidine 5'-diphospho)-2-C-methyl-D-erythritol kinase [Rhodococcus oxybenzonivorans]MDV7274777.1 4-(cytidine 5'-diphospho)-2-C-methyl-D-erythritol kinase [Rhodococcus oxybenzonivorans]MDV7335016.1 4-(cytidine 5'-diphospho)-2-C-methyl-D-erythritol kinase [Rhodococcus oxybenzonivorans]MDV7345727.
MLSVVPRPVVVRAPSKVNLHLAVGDQRADGYHELNTVFQALSLGDTVSVAPADALTVKVRGEDARVVPTDSRNLVWKAAEMLAVEADRRPDIEISIDKGIPVAGGMAGGSADAAATLVALNALWHLDLSREDLHSFAAKLGSDVPFALHGGTAFGTGRGERLLPVLSRSTFHWVLALAKGGLSTPTVFRELDRLRAAGTPPKLGGADDLMHALTTGDAATLAPLLGNDLQAAALSLEPRLRRTLRAGVAAGALAGIVSGSGPTCAFLCADADAAVRVSAELAGAGVCRTVRVASGPVPGARIINDAAEGSH